MMWFDSFPIVRPRLAVRLPGLLPVLEPGVELVVLVLGVQHRLPGVLVEGAPMGKVPEAILPQRMEFVAAAGVFYLPGVFADAGVFML